MPVILILFNVNLSDLINQVCCKAPLFSERWGFSFDLMRRTGIRHEEMDLSRWSVYDSDSFVLECAKRGEQRIILKSDLGIELSLIVSDGLQATLVNSRTTLTNAFMRLSYPYRIMLNSSNVFLHAFRYAKIKEMYASGVSVYDIRTYIGHKDLKNTLGYIGRELEILKI